MSAHFKRCHRWRFAFCGNAKSNGLMVSKVFVQNASEEAEALRLALGDAKKVLHDPRFLDKHQIR